MLSPYLRGEVADAAAQRQPADAGGADDPAGSGHADLVRWPRRPRPRCSRLSTRTVLRAASTLDLLHRRQVDHDAVVDSAQPAAVVAAAADRQEQCRARGHS